jgi:hypothetical protein
MKRRMPPVAHARDQSVLDRIDAAIFDMARVIGLVADRMLPEPPLPDAAFAAPRAPSCVRKGDMEIHPIRNDDDHAAAIREIENLAGAAPGTERGDKLEVLAILVEKYEEQRWPNIDVSDPIDLLIMPSKNWDIRKPSWQSCSALDRVHQSY